MNSLALLRARPLIIVFVERRTTITSVAAVVWFAVTVCFSRKGTESGAAGARTAPVQFEADPAEADPFGLDAFLKDAKSSKKK